MKNKVTSLFSIGLYREGLRQTRPVGIAFIGLSILLSLTDLINNISFNRFEISLGGSESYVLDTSIMVPTVLAYCVMAPLLCLSLFHFLNSRSASDYWHSIPQSRSTLFFSFASAIFTWSISGVLISTLFTVASGILIPGAVVPWGNLATALLYAIPCTILVMGAVLLAMTVTGNLLSQIVTSLLIIFLPRSLMLLFCATVTDLAPTIPSADRVLGIFSNGALNMVFSTISDTFFGVGTDISIGWSVLYTVVLGLIYLAAALCLFCRRRSEAASAPATNKFVQGAIRVMVAFVICLIPCYEITHRMLHHSPFDETYLIIYGFALIVYVLYEVLSTRSIKSIANSYKELAIGLVALVALNVLFILGPVAVARQHLQYSPSADEVQSISLTADKYTNTYNRLLVDSIEITDGSCISKACELISDNNSRFLNGGNANDVYNSHSELITFTHKNGKSRTVRVFFDPDKRGNLIEAMHKSPEFAQAATAMPDFDTIDSIGCDLSNPDDMNKLAKMLFDELSAMSVAERGLVSNYDTWQYPMNTIYQMDSADNSAAANYCLTTLSVSGTVNGVNYYNNYDITPMTPKAADIYISLYKAQNSAIPLSEALAEFDGCDYGHISIDGGNLIAPTGEYVYTETQFCDKTSKNGSIDLSFGLIGGNYEKIIDELLSNESKQIDMSKPFYRVHVYCETYSNEGYSSCNDYSYYIPAAETEPMMLQWRGAGSAEYAGDEDFYLHTATTHAVG